MTASFDMKIIPTLFAFNLYPRKSRKETHLRFVSISIQWRHNSSVSSKDVSDEGISIPEELKALDL
jgi:hypothetical protein